MDTAIHVLPTPEAASDAAARRWVTLARDAIAQDGRFNVALAGGGTPRGLYERLARPPLREEVDWRRVHLFFGDERSVPPDHADSNYRMAHETLVGQVPVAAQHVHPITARTARIREDAWAYGRLLRRELPLTAGGVPRFHLILLGLGPDGHVASLFPGTCIQHEVHVPVAAVYVPRLKTWRISVTYPVLNQADHIVLLAEGEGKADIVARACQRPATAALLPVQRIEPAGTLEWFLDRAAAARLPAGDTLA